MARRFLIDVDDRDEPGHDGKGAAFDPGSGVDDVAEKRA
jgi:hypothetical protein